MAFALKCPNGIKKPGAFLNIYIRLLVSEGKVDVHFK